MKTRKSAREKLEKDQARKVEDTLKGRMLIPKPLDVDALIRQIPEGRLATLDQIRQHLAMDFQADYCCPLVSGMFLRMAAEAAEEDLNRGETVITPWWRVVKADGSLNEKFPGGSGHQAIHLREEGHSIQPGEGKKPPRVIDYEKALHLW